MMQSFAVYVGGEQFALLERHSRANKEEQWHLLSLR